MKNPTASAKALTGLLKRLPEGTAPAPSPDPIAVLAQSFLMWESTSEKAAKAYEKLISPLVDYNDMRVTMPSEMAELVGDRTVAGLDRFRRLRAVLRNVYLREHDVTLDRVRESGKRDAKKYVDSLEGMVPYVAARMLLLAFDGHAVPVDGQVLRALIDEGVLGDDVEIGEASAWLARQVKAGDGIRVHAVLQAWVDGGAGRARPSSRKTPTKKAPARKKTPARAARTSTKTSSERTTKKKASVKSGGRTSAKKTAVKKTSKKTTKKTSKKVAARR